MALRAASAGARAAVRAAKDAGEGGPLPPEERKSMLAGVALGALFPGIGLAYAAPLSAAAILTVAVAAVFGALTLLGHVPLLGFLFWWLKYVVFALTGLGSALLGALYVANYNKRGRRTLLSENAPADKRLPI